MPIKKSLPLKPLKVVPQVKKAVYVPAFTKPIKVPDWFKTTTPPDLSIIIPLKNREQLEQQVATFDLTPDGITKEILYIDDQQQTSDYVVACWEKRKAELKQPVGKIYINNKSAGGAYCYNAMVKSSLAKYILLANSETTFSFGWIKGMMAGIDKVDAIGHFQESMADSYILLKRANFSDFDRDKPEAIIRDVLRGKSTIAHPRKNHID